MGLIITARSHSLATSFAVTMPQEVLPPWAQSSGKTIQTGGFVQMLHWDCHLVCHAQGQLAQLQESKPEKQAPASPT